MPRCRAPAAPNAVSGVAADQHFLLPLRMLSRLRLRLMCDVTRFLERKKTTFTSPSGRATPPRQPPLPLCGRSCRNQLLPPRVSPPVAAPKNRVVRKRALVRASARLRALAGPQALQNHTALPGASAAHQGRCAARPLGRSRSQPPAESPARAREAWCSQQRGVNLQGAPGGTSASVPL